MIRPAPRLTALVAVFYALAAMAPAQTVVGKSAVDGRVIELLSDKTWRFQDATETDPPSPEIAAQYHFNDRHYVFVAMAKALSNEHPDLHREFLGPRRIT